MKIIEKLGLAALSVFLAIQPVYDSVSNYSDRHRKIELPASSPIDRNLLPHKNYKTEDFKSDSDEVLLARMIFGECDECSEIEKMSVAWTALNRVKDGKDWNGNTIREVILEPYQYSCFNNDFNHRVKDPISYNADGFFDALRISKGILNGDYGDPTEGSTHFINPDHPSFKYRDLPRWTSELHKIGRIDGSIHVFYKST